MLRPSISSMPLLAPRRAPERPDHRRRLSTGSGREADARHRHLVGGHQGRPGLRYSTVACVRQAGFAAMQRLPRPATPSDSAPRPKGLRMVEAHLPVPIGRRPLRELGLIDD